MSNKPDTGSDWQKDGFDFSSSGNAANTRQDYLLKSLYFEKTRLAGEKTVQFSGLLLAPFF